MIKERIKHLIHLQSAFFAKLHMIYHQSAQIQNLMHIGIALIMNNLTMLKIHEISEKYGTRVSHHFEEMASFIMSSSLPSLLHHSYASNSPIATQIDPSKP